MENQQSLQREAGPASRSCNLSEDVLRLILEYSAPQNPNERWKWMCRTTEISPIVRNILMVKNNEALPSEFDMEETVVPRGQNSWDYPDRIPHYLRAPLLRSFLSGPWRVQNLVKFTVCSTACENIHVAGSPIKDALRSILMAPDLFPNLEMLCIEAWFGTLIDAKALRGIAQNFPRLRQLILHGRFNDDGETDITPAEFGSFGMNLQQPLHTLLLLHVKWMTDAHMEQFLLHHQCTDLRSLHLGNLGQLTNTTSDAISRYCCQLEHVSLVNSAVTRAGLSSLIEANCNLHSINVAGCSRLGLADGLRGPALYDVIVKPAPLLQTLGANFCNWFTDDCLDRLIERQKEQSGGVSLRNLDIYETNITPAGLRSAFESGVLGRIYIGCSGEELLHGDPKALHMRSSLNEWRELARDYETKVHFTQFPLTHRRSILKDW
jgi:hypothetical protein